MVTVTAVSLFWSPVFGVFAVAVILNVCGLLEAGQLPDVAVIVIPDGGVSVHGMLLLEAGTVTENVIVSPALYESLSLAMVRVEVDVDVVADVDVDMDEDEDVV